MRQIARTQSRSVGPRDGWACRSNLTASMYLQAFAGNLVSRGRASRSARPDRRAGDDVRRSRPSAPQIAEVTETADYRRSAQHGLPVGHRSDAATKPYNTGFSEHDHYERSPPRRHWRPGWRWQDHTDRHHRQSSDATAVVGVITNDIYTQEDAEALMRMQILPQDRIIGVETGGCPHTAIREDASINLAAIAEMTARHPDLDIVLIESGGDNLSATFSPELGRPDDLCDRRRRGRGDSAQGRPCHHQIRHPGHQ